METATYFVTPSCAFYVVVRVITHYIIFILYWSGSSLFGLNVIQWNNTITKHTLKSVSTSILPTNNRIIQLFFFIKRLLHIYFPHEIYRIQLAFNSISISHHQMKCKWLLSLFEIRALPMMVLEFFFSSSPLRESLELCVYISYIPYKI